MNPEQRTMHFVVETAMYVNIPLPVMDYLNTIRSEVSTTAPQLYLHYHYVWRNNNYEARRPDRLLALFLYRCRHYRPRNSRHQCAFCVNSTKNSHCFDITIARERESAPGNPPILPLLAKRCKNLVEFEFLVD